MIIKKNIVALCLALSSPYCFANSASINEIIASIDQHPKVVTMARVLSSQRIQTNIVRSEGPQINFSTKGNLPIARNINTNLYRNPVDGRTYIDGLITGSMTLYDFGELDANIAANIALELSSELEYEDAREAILLKLFNLIIDFHRLEAIRVSLVRSITNTNETLIQTKQLYKSGVGTIDDVREIELSRLDIESQLQLLNIKREEVLQNLRYEFGFSTGKFDAIYEVANSLNHSSPLISNSKTLKSARLKAIHQLKVDSIEQQISAINATRMPNVSGVITTTFYDIARGLNEYQVTGGVNIALPLFDSGRSDVQMQSALNNIGIEDDKFRSIIFSKELALEDLYRQIQSLRSVNSSNLIKQSELNEKITRLELKQKTSNSALVAKVKTQIELDKLERDLLNYDYVVKQSNLKHLRLNETLLSEFSQLNLNQ
jgi:outer membrane protein TolC